MKLVVFSNYVLNWKFFRTLKLISIVLNSESGPICKYLGSFGLYYNLKKFPAKSINSGTKAGNCLTNSG